jgi:cytidine deaminase
MSTHDPQDSLVPVSVGLTKPLEGPELVVGLVGAVGTDLELVRDVLTEELRRLKYEAVDIRISQLMHDIDPTLPVAGPQDVRFKRHMDAGTAIRTKLKRGDALALLTIGKIRDERQERTGSASQPIQRGAYIIRSLKHPAEVSTLRNVYGRAFFLMGAYTSRDHRRSKLASIIAASKFLSRPEDANEAAEHLIWRDEEETGNKYGQRLRDTFPLADVFVNARDRSTLRRDIQRFLELVFGYQFHTPTPDEHAMSHARVAALRSADLSRQVGAVITDHDGRILASGCNEVPKFGGGAYWEDTPGDKRDFQLGEDPSSKVKLRLLEQILFRLQQGGWLNESKKDADVQELVREAIYDPETPLMDGVRLMDLLEFGRVVHAEMGALMDAAQRGTSVQGMRLYSTTFPCHICARHIIASGISEVQYIEPYPKSLAGELHSDSMVIENALMRDRVVFKPFAGIAPGRYDELFNMAQRKDKQGNALAWEAAKSTPRIERFVLSYLLVETVATNELKELLKEAGIVVA